MVIKGLTLEMRAHGLVTKPASLYSSFEVLRSASHQKGIKDVLVNKSGGKVDTSFYSLDLSSAHRVLGIPPAEVVVKSGVTWYISTLECQILGLVKDIILIDLENKNGLSNSAILTQRNNMSARLDKLVALDSKLRYYTDAMCGYDANYFYVVADQSVAAMRPIWQKQDSHKAGLIDWMLNRIADDFDFDKDLVLAELEKSDIADWIASSSVYRIPKAAVVTTQLSEINDELVEWMIRQFTTGSRTLGRKIADDVVAHCSQFGIPKVSGSVNLSFNAARSIEMGYIEQEVAGEERNGSFVLSYDDLVVTSSNATTKVLANSFVRFTFKKTRDTLEEDWSALDNLVSTSKSQYDAWSAALDKRLSAAWQLSWAKRRSGEISEYTPGSDLTSRYVINLVQPLQSPFIRESGEVTLE